MSRICPSCGGVIGRDCFNPQECAVITNRMEAQKEHEFEVLKANFNRLCEIIERKLGWDLSELGYKKAPFQNTDSLTYVPDEDNLPF